MSQAYGFGIGAFIASIVGLISWFAIQIFPELAEVWDFGPSRRHFITCCRTIFDLALLAGIFCLAGAILSLLDRSKNRSSNGASRSRLD
jgi:hypothetical protein